jgi:hypothetical protein
MTRNLGNRARLARILAALPLLACGVMAPLALPIRLLAFGLPALYLVLTALAGSCLGYSLMGRSSCAPAARDT